MPKVILVRHCESESNAAGHAMGQGNAPLSERGRDQAAALEAAFRSNPVAGARLVTSPLTRAVDTGGAIARALRLTGETDERFSAGESIAGRLDLRAPETLRTIGGEVLEALSERLEPDRTLIAVSHRYPIWALMTRLAGEDDGKALVDALGNGDALVFVLEDGKAGLVTHRPLGDT